MVVTLKVNKSRIVHPSLFQAREKCQFAEHFMQICPHSREMLAVLKMLLLQQTGGGNVGTLSPVSPSHSTVRGPNLQMERLR